MKLAFFDSHSFDRKAFDRSNAKYRHEISYFEPKLGKDTARLAAGFDAVCAFVNDRLDRDTLQVLKDEGIRMIALRSAGFNNVDIRAARELDLPVVRVPDYSPYAVAEHAVALILTMNRHIHRAYNRVRDMNFSLDGLVGFDLHGKTVGIIGTGKIGQAFASIMRGFGCQILAFDLNPDPALSDRFDVHYVPLNQLLQEANIISLHVPLTPDSHHIINSEAFDRMMPGVMLVNTSRGGLVETSALIRALKKGIVGFAALDVYEEEADIFFQDRSESGIQDDILARLTTFPNVLITSHQGFLTHEALAHIANATLKNLSAFENHKPLLNQIMGD